MNSIRGWTSYIDNRSYANTWAYCSVKSVMNIGYFTSNQYHNFMNLITLLHTKILDYQNTKQNNNKQKRASCTTNFNSMLILYLS